MPRTVAVIPAHDEEEAVALVVTKTKAHVDAVLIVDDGSTDSTAEEARKAGAEVLSLKPNRGKGGALRAGLARATEMGAEIIITLDADGEHDPEELPQFLKAIENADVVLGSREVYRSGIRKVLNNVALFWFQLFDPSIKDTICGYRAFRTEVLPQLVTDAAGFAYEQEVLLLALAAGLRVVSIDIRTIPRTRSHVTPYEIVKANNHFDRWVLTHLASLPLPPWRKALLAAGTSAGLLMGAPAEWALARKKKR